MTYSSKVDWWLAAIVLGSLAGPLVLGYTMAPDHETRTAVLLVTLAAIGLELLVLALIAWPIEYALEDSHLRIRAGFLLRWKIPYQEISQVYPTNNPLSSPAWSLDRLQIDKFSGPPMLISPGDQDRFLSEIAMRAGLTHAGTRLVRRDAFPFRQSQI